MLCADKTGTLTQNALTLGDPFCLEGVKPEDVVLAGALASREENDDPIDLAVLDGLSDPKDLHGYTVTHFEPFDPVHKRTEASVTSGAKNAAAFKVSKGAPQVMLELVSNGKTVKNAVDTAVNDFAARGFRSLGVARADGDGKWRFLGVLPLFNPPRDDAAETISMARDMGVTVKMVTGDALAIAKETADKVGLGTGILDAAGLGDSKKKETAKTGEAIETADGFAQVFPEHKYHIVDVLQKRGHIVGMTGDGVNDAPALKKADCGIAVSGATDAARAAAAIVLLTPGLSVIIDAIKESRRIFQRMNSYDKVHYRNEPEAWNMRLVLGIATVLGVVGPIAAFGLFYLGDRVFNLGHPQLQTLMYLMLSVAGHLTIFLTRTRGPFWSIRPAKILWMAVLGTQAVATLIAVYGLFMTPLGWGWAGFVWIYAIIWALLSDRIKLLAYRILDPIKKVAPVTAPEAAIA
nr:HAD-IC family P-type ATPase [Demequina lutea]